MAPGHESGQSAGCGFADDVGDYLLDPAIRLQLFRVHLSLQTGHFAGVRFALANADYHAWRYRSFQRQLRRFNQLCHRALSWRLADRRHSDLSRYDRGLCGVWFADLSAPTSVNHSHLGHVVYLAGRGHHSVAIARWLSAGMA